MKANGLTVLWWSNGADYLDYVDGIRVFNLEPGAVDDFLVGAPSTSVSLGLTRNGIEMTIDVTRERIAAEARADVAATSGACAFHVSLPLC